MINKTSDSLDKYNSCDDAFVDSFEKLEDDLDRAVHYEDDENEEKFPTMACAYTKHSGGSGDMCLNCKFYDGPFKFCTHRMLEDVSSRISKLRSED